MRAPNHAILWHMFAKTKLLSDNLFGSCGEVLAIDVEHVRLSTIEPNGTDHAFNECTPAFLTIA